MSSTATIVERLFGRITAEIQRYFPDFNPNYSQKTATKALAKAIAPEVRNLELYGDQIAKQATPLTADSKSESDIGSLEDWGEIKLGRSPYLPTQGTYQIEILPDIAGNGGTYLVGTQFVSSRTGQVYLLQNEVTLIAGEASVLGEVQSVAGGTAVSLEVGDSLSSQQIITGLSPDTSVTLVLATPVDGETVEEYRDSVNQSFLLTPRGGDRGDYVIWADEVPGVAKAYPYAGGDIDDEEARLGGAFVYIRSEDADGLPSQALIDDVKQKYNEKAPTNAGYVVVTGIVQYTLDLKVTSLSVDPSDEANVKATIVSATTAYFSSLEPFLDGVDRPQDRADLVEKGVLFGLIQNAISGLATIGDITLTLQVTGDIVISHQLTFGEIPVLGNITYV